MSVSATYGFTGRPNSVAAASSGSYTVPAGTYARVLMSCWDGSISVNGTVVLSAGWSSWNAIQVTNSPATIFLSGSSGSKGIATNGAGTVGADVFANATASSRPINTGSVWLPAGTVLSISGSGGLCIQLFNV